jgi:alkylation response protein AidB-like acyl-CoA dehydrogenase
MRLSAVSHVVDSIFGGTTEIQKEIIARGLGLQP